MLQTPFIFLDLSYTHSYSKPKAIFLSSYESNWQRDVEKITLNTKAIIKPNYVL